MNTAQNQRHMETERKLREALVFYMEQDLEPTVGQLCSRSGINRSFLNMLLFPRASHGVFRREKRQKAPSL